VTSSFLALVFGMRELCANPLSLEAAEVLKIKPDVNLENDILA
jgi:hypothetical protein